MSSGGRRPTRPGMMPGGVGQGWVPGVSMPPLGYGLVTPQPHMAAPQPPMAPHQPPLMAPQQAWQQQQQQQQHFMAQQTAMPGVPMGVPTLTPQQQQQWLEAQRRAAEEQRKYYEQMMKQRQFDQQKMRLKAFSATKKAGVSADTMIESILGGKDTHKQRSPQPLKKTGGSEEQGSHVAPPTTTTATTLPQPQPQTQPQPHRQGTAVDWTKMGNVNSLFESPKKTTTATATTTDTTNPTTPPPPPAQPQPQDTTTTTTATTTAPQQPSGDAMRGHTAQTAQTAAPAQHGRKNKSAMTLPQWLKEVDALPEVYKRAGGLVAGVEGWVDTSRAYVLLMKTALPPPLLGVLWEMVNCTAPGQLTQHEFSALLALVALVQSGQPITGPDALSATTEPLLPFIDHPALAPLVQEHLQKHQDTTTTTNGTTTTTTTTTTQDDEFDDFVSVTVTASNTPAPPQANAQVTGYVSPAQAQVVTAPTTAAPKTLTQQTTDKNKAMNLPTLGLSPEPSPTASFDDDFDDFQSAVPSVVPLGSAVTGGQGGQGGQGVAATTTTATTAMPSEQPLAAPVLLPEKTGGGGDRYAVFREMGMTETDAENATEKAAENPDDSFGEFCSSEVASLSLAQGTAAALPGLLQCHSASGTSNTSPISFEVYSTPPEALPEAQPFEADFSSAFAPARPPDNYADLHDAMKRAQEEQKRKEESAWSDPFGEFEEAPSAAAVASAGVTAAGVAGGGGGVSGGVSIPSAPGLSLPWMKVGCGGEEEEEEEDFGDFMGPSGGGGGGGSLAFPHLENLGETQSVASLELPGLEMTVGVEAASETLGSTHSPDLLLQARGDMGSVEDQLCGLSVEAPPPAAAAAGSTTTTTTTTIPPAAAAAGGGGMEPYCSSSGLVDKYSIIREEASRGSQHSGEAHTGSWERCLEGSVKLLQEAHGTLTSPALPPALRSQALATSQMQDYLANVQEVWLVCGRIAASSRRVTTSCKVDQLLSEAHTIWQGIVAGAEDAIAKPESESERSNDDKEKENQMGEGEVCGVCLAGGGSRLSYGGHSYHPPCANLWLNCVDLLLPSLTPVTLL